MRVIARLCLMAMICAVILGAAPKVFAQSRTFNALFFKPATGKNPYLMMHGTDTLHQWQFQVAEYISYGYQPLEMSQGGRRLQGVIDHSLVSDFTASIGFLEWFQVGFDVPVVLINQFRAPLTPATTPLQNHVSLSDIRFELKFKALDSCKFPVGLAFIPFVTIPTGNDQYYVGDPGMTGGIRVAVDAEVQKYLGLTLNLGYRGGKRVQIQNVDFQHRLLLGFGIYGRLPRGFSLFGEMNVEPAFSDFMSDRDMNPLEVMAGLKWDIKKTGVSLLAAGGSCAVCGVMGARARAVLGVRYRYNTKKYQQKDVEDWQPCRKRFAGGLTPEEIYYLKLNCPPNPDDFKQGVHDDACPKFYELSEIADLMMHCPPKPEDFRPGIHDDACPKIYILTDKYTTSELQDIYAIMAAEYGVRCPSNPEDFNPMLHDQACPKYYDMKEISLMSAKCPDDAEDYIPGVDDSACPKYYTLRDQYPEDQWKFIEKLSKKDTDKDRINDYLDLCPNQPEDYNGFADDDGCPDQGIAAISGGEIKTFKPVYFEFNRAKLNYDSEQALDQVIALINANPWIRKVLVGGHADERGTDIANQRISMRRSDVVIEYMLTHGVRHDVRLAPVGYGATKPVAIGTTEQDYARNRRVNFIIAAEGFIPPPEATRRPKAIKKKKEVSQPAETPKRWE